MIDFLEIVIPIDPSAVTDAVRRLLRTGGPEPAVPSDAVITGSLRESEFELHVRNAILGETAAVCRGICAAVSGGTRIHLSFVRQRVLRRARFFVAIATLGIIGAMWGLHGTDGKPLLTPLHLVFVLGAIVFASGLLLVVEGSAVQTECGAILTALRLMLEDAARQHGASWTFPTLGPVAVADAAPVSR